MQRLTIGEIVFVELCHLRTFLGTYEQFISVLWNNILYWQCLEVFMEQRPDYITIVGKYDKKIYRKIILNLFRRPMPSTAQVRRSEYDKGDDNTDDKTYNPHTDTGTFIVLYM